MTTMKKKYSCRSSNMNDNKRRFRRRRHNHYPILRILNFTIAIIIATTTMTTTTIIPSPFIVVAASFVTTTTTTTTKTKQVPSSLSTTSPMGRKAFDASLQRYDDVQQQQQQYLKQGALLMTKQTNNNNNNNNNDISEDDDDDEDDDNNPNETNLPPPIITTLNRRSLLSLTTTTLLTAYTTIRSPYGRALAVSLPDIPLLKNENFVRNPVNVLFKSISGETCLLDMLPVTNGVFRRIQQDIEQVSYVRVSAVDDQAWKISTKASQSVLQFLDAKRSSLEPIFNEDDSTIVTLAKAEAGERLIGDLRSSIIDMIDATSARDAPRTYAAQKNALMSLANVGEFLVSRYPYPVPDEGKYSYLPRLLGRTTVCFVLERKGKALGNVTMVVDGYAAPITAGNFVDLCVRGFYTGLPLKSVTKKLGLEPLQSEDLLVVNTIRSLPKLVSEFKLGGGGGGGEAGSMEDEGDGGSSSSSLTLPVWGSYKDGFYDPLTAKPRHIPLELVKIDKASGYAKMIYPMMNSELQQEQQKSFEQVLSFDIPGLVAMNHPDKFPNMGSSEFFVLSNKNMTPEKVKLLDGQYAPFGYVVKGLDLIQELQPGDVISSTIVDESGLMNLVKLRGTSFADVIQGSSDSNDEEKGGS